MTKQFVHKRQFLSDIPRAAEVPTANFCVDLTEKENEEQRS